MKTNHSLIGGRGWTQSILLPALLIGLTIAVSPVRGATPSELLEQGIYSEETKGDLDAAMRLYQQVVKEAKAGEKSAAEAQYRLGVCYYKEKDYSAATAAFEKVVKNYPEQKALVRLASEYLAGAVALLPAPWTDGEEMKLDLRYRTGYKAGYVRYLVNAGALDGRKIWKLSSRLAAGPRQASLVEVEADSLKPIRCHWKHSMLGDATATYQPGRVEVRLKGDDQVRTVDLEGVCYDNEEVVQLIRRLPLATNYTTTLHIFSALGPSSIIPIKLTVAGLDEVKVPAGTFECYRVKLNLVNQTFWYSTDEHRYLVKFDAGAVRAELTGVDQDQPAPDESMFNFEVGKQEGGIPTIQAQASQPPQNQAKLLVLAAAKLGRVPDAANWCQQLNASAPNLPQIPTNTVFALNAQVAGRSLTSLPPDIVVFFETPNHRMNQVGGVELLARKASGVAIAFADGRALVCDPDDAAKLRWSP